MLATPSTVKHCLLSYVSDGPFTTDKYRSRLILKISKKVLVDLGGKNSKLITGIIININSVAITGVFYVQPTCSNTHSSTKKLAIATWQRRERQCKLPDAKPVDVPGETVCTKIDRGDKSFN